MPISFVEHPGATRNSLALVPLMDMLNHTCSAQAAGAWSPRTQRYEVCVHDSYVRGEEVGRSVCVGVGRVKGK